MVGKLLEMDDACVLAGGNLSLINLLEKLPNFTMALLGIKTNIELNTLINEWNQDNTFEISKTDARTTKLESLLNDLTLLEEKEDDLRQREFIPEADKIASFIKSIKSISAVSFKSMTNLEMDNFVRVNCKKIDNLIPIINDQRGLGAWTQGIIDVMVAILDVFTLLLTTRIPNSFFKLPPTKTEATIMDLKNTLINIVSDSTNEINVDEHLLKQ